MTRATVALAMTWLAAAAAASRARADAGAGPGAAGARAVTVFRPLGAGEALVEVAMRTRAELVAGGYSASIVECAMSSGKCHAAGEGGAIATVATFEYGGETLTEVTTAANARQPRIKLVRAEVPGTEPKVLAIRAVELLRAALLDPIAAQSGVPAAALEARPPAASVRVATVAAGDARTSRSEEAGEDLAPPVDTIRWAVAVGGTMLQSTGALADSYGLLVRAGYVGRSGAGLAVLFAAVELTPDLEVVQGTVSVHQELGLVEGSYRFRRDQHLQPYVTVGLGGYHLGVRGNASSPGVVFAPAGTSVAGRSAGAWEIVASGGGGLQAVVRNGFGLLADARAMLAGPEVVVSDAAVRIGGPLLMLSLAVQKIF